LAAKSLAFVNPKDTRPIKLFFQDEARFGRIDNITSCWVPPNTRALVTNQIIREYTYLYGAFCPETGEQFTMILPYANKECMNIFTREFSMQFSNYRVIMGMDNASWHGSKIGENTDNIVPLFQPSHSPELNPAEHIWHYIRESGGFKNHTFISIQEVEESLCVAVNSLLTDKNKIKSITNFEWIKLAISNNMIAV
jgi:transposase